MPVFHHYVMYYKLKSAAYLFNLTLKKWVVLKMHVGVFVG